MLRNLFKIQLLQKSLITVNAIIKNIIGLVLVESQNNSEITFFIMK